MRPAERIEAILHKADCEAPEALRQRLWKDIAETLHGSDATRQRHGDAPVWTILMAGKTARLVAATPLSGRFLWPAKPQDWSSRRSS